MFDVNLNVFIIIIFQQIPEEVELVWDDTVAPETCIDFDAPHVSTKDVLLSFFAAFGFFGAVLTLVTLSDPVGSNPVARRSAVISQESFDFSMGRKNALTHGEEE